MDRASNPAYPVQVRQWKWFALWAVTRAAAQVSPSPQSELRAAIDQLAAAGNYTWEQKRDTELNSVRAKRKSDMEGRTVIGEFTQATVGGKNAVIFAGETAFQLHDGWRHMHDLTPLDIIELQPGIARGASPRTVTREEQKFRNFELRLPHDVLQRIFAVATNYRLQGSVIVAEIDPTLMAASDLESYLRGGRFPIAPPKASSFPIAGPSRSPLGSVLGGILPRRRATPRPTQWKEEAIILVRLNKGLIDEFTLEVHKSGPGDPTDPAAEKFESRVTLITTVSRIGATKVEISGEARALFPSAPP